MGTSLIDQVTDIVEKGAHTEKCVVLVPSPRSIGRCCSICVSLIICLTVAM